MSAISQLDELNEKLDKLYSIKRQTSDFGTTPLAKVIILRDTSNFVLKNQNQISAKKQSRLKAIILSFSAYESANTIIYYPYVKSSFFVMYNEGINENIRYPAFVNGGVVLKDIELDPVYTSQNFMDLGVNINTIDDRENGLLIRYIENKDVDEAIFNTRMKIYNLTHKGDELQHLHKEIEELKINLSRVEGIVTIPRFNNTRNNRNNRASSMSREHASRFINESKPKTRSKPPPLGIYRSRYRSRANSPRPSTLRALKPLQVNNV